MDKHKITRIKRNLEDRGISLAGIAREEGVSRNHVSATLRGERDSSRIRAAIAAKLGWNPWEESDAKKKSSLSA